MPWSAGHPCAQPGCAAIVPRGQPRCPVHTKAHQVEDRARRGSSTQRGYDARWRAARASFLAENPLCVECSAEGRAVPAFAVDHRVPHRGDQALFWQQSNWQPLCERHHNAKAARERLYRSP